ncbi:MAG: type II toxin-antitoxin system PemK/MazF family toxin, partial [Prevotellaceae bacterium]|nr:type II toxin-antitoxin system PemK/MazF family toxin [Prevotellaceae bacterium]
KQSEIWSIDVGPIKEPEKQRRIPVVIVNDDQYVSLPLKLIVSVTEWKDYYENFPWMIKIFPDDFNGLSEISAIDCFQICFVHKEKLIKQLGSVDIDIFNKMQETIRDVLGV